MLGCVFAPPFFFASFIEWRSLKYCIVYLCLHENECGIQGQLNGVGAWKVLAKELAGVKLQLGEYRKQNRSDCVVLMSITITFYILQHQQQWVVLYA